MPIPRDGVHSGGTEPECETQKLIYFPVSHVDTILIIYIYFCLIMTNDIGVNVALSFMQLKHLSNVTKCEC